MRRIDLDPLSDEQIAAVLRSKTATKRIEFAGEERYFFFGGLSFDLAERYGADLEELLRITDDPEESAKAKIDAMALIIYCMMAPFKTCPEPALVKLHVGAMGSDEAQDFMRKVMPNGTDEAGNAPAGKDIKASPSPSERSASPATASERATTAS